MIPLAQRFIVAGLVMVSLGTLIGIGCIALDCARYVRQIFKNKQERS